MITLSEPARYYFHHSVQDSSSRISGLALRRGRGLTLTLVTGVRSEKVRRKPPACNTQLVSRLDTGQGCRRRDSFKIVEPLHMLDQGVFSAKTR